jgi:hypothetical protein
VRFIIVVLPNGDLLKITLKKISGFLNKYYSTVNCKHDSL